MVKKPKNYINSKDHDYRNDPAVLELIDTLRKMFNIDFKLVEVNRFGTLQLVSLDNQIAVLSGSYSTTFYFKGYYGYTSRTVTYIDNVTKKEIFNTYIQFKTNSLSYKSIYNDFTNIDFLMWK